MSEPDGAPGGFLARWSKRKRAVVVPEDEARAEQSTITSREEDVPADPAELEPEFDVSTLPGLDELTAETDVSVFLQRGVPEALKNAALRKAWVLDPFLRDYVGPVENGYNFNDPASIPGFGAMHAHTDTAAMLRGITGEPAPEDIPDAAPPAQASRSAEAVAGNDEGRSDSSLLSDPAPDPAAPPAENAAAAEENHPDGDAAMHNELIENIEENRVFLRKKRHGGAVPN